MTTKKKYLRENTFQFSVSFPKITVEEIDIICRNLYLSRSSWLFAAAKEKLERERLKKIEKLKKELNENG
jgi:metal-responsive CopG/Arc/MetJ family transcriptional regulator